MDEFDVYRARSYGGYVETFPGVDDDGAAAVEFGLNGNVENEWPKRERERDRSTRRRSFRNVSAEATADESGSVAWADRSHGGPPRSGSERKRTERTRTNSHVTVAVEPPSPTEVHQRSQPRRTGGGPVVVPANVTAADPGRAPTSAGAKGGLLHRTRTMPARRSASPRRRHSPLCQPVIVEPTADSPTSPPGSSADEVGECKIYRVRSFTTKKGGVVVNRGDSIKICSARRASRCDSLLLAPSTTGAESRRYSAASNAGGGRSSLQPFHPSPCELRRSSASCLVAANSVEPTGLSGDGRGGGGGGHRSRAALSPRSSCRNVAYDANQDDSPLGGTEATIAPGRKASAVRMHSQTGDPCVHHRVGAEDIEETQNEESGFRLNSRTKEADDNGEDDDCDDADAAGPEEHVYKVAVVGSSGVGKTTLIRQLLTSEYLANKENYQGKTRHSRFSS